MIKDIKVSLVRTKYKRIPIVDCFHCGLKDTPLSQECRIYKHKDTGKKIELFFVSCPHCQTLFNWDKETMKHIKGYISVRDIEKLGWSLKDRDLAKDQLRD